MPLKKPGNKLTKNPNPVKEQGNVVQTADGHLLSLTSMVPLPAVTLNTEQFYWPDCFVVMTASRVDLYKKNPKTGWNEKTDNGDKIKIGKKGIRLMLADAGLAQSTLDRGGDLDGLSQIQCDIDEDLPLQDFKPEETTITLKKPVLMLAYGGQDVNRLVIKAEGYEIV